MFLLILNTSADSKESMTEMVNNANESNVMFVLSILSFIFGVVGIIGIYFTVRSYFDQKKTSSAFNEILTQANKDWVGKYTSEEISSLNQQLTELTNQINNAIPQKAELTFLEYKENSLRNEIETLIKEYKKILVKLNKQGVNSQISPEILKHINDEMKKKIEDGRGKTNYIIIILLLILIFPLFNEQFYSIIRNVIWMLDANLTVEMVTTYIFGMIFSSSIMLNIKLKRLNIWILSHKKKTIILSILLFFIWGVLIYLLSYDVFIVTFIAQAIAGFVSLAIFSIDIRFVKILIKNIR